MARGWWVFSTHKMMNKKTKRNPNFHYKVRHIRMSDKVWESLKEKRQNSKKTWNLFICELMGKK